MGYNKRYDEWINFTSEWIVENEEEEDEFYDPVDEVRAALGELSSIDDVTAKVVPLYSSDYNQTVKKMNVLSVQMIQFCAESLKISIKTADDKRITKPDLIKLIISKIKSYLPSQCCLCSESFRLKVTDVALFTCAGCKRASHDCEAYRNFKKSLSYGLPKGFVWLCEDCGEADIPNPKPVTMKSTVQPVAQSVVDTGKSDADANEAAGAADGTPQPKVNNQTNAENSVTPRVCPEYKKSNCPHGLRGNKLINGNKCKFSHPKPCQKYCGYGSKGEFGCKAGSKCPNFHPRLCRYSLSKKLCTNEHCNFVHLKGTARRAAQKGEAPNFSRTEKKNETNSKEVTTQPVKSKPHMVEPQSKRDFLGLAERMEKRFEDLAESMNKRILALQQNIQAQHFYPPHPIIPYPPPTMMGYPHPQQLHPMPAPMGRSPVVSHNHVPSSF